MARRSYRIFDEHYPYFITCGVQFGLPLFSDPRAAEIVLDNIAHLRNEKNVQVMAYVIMENHCHLIVWGDDLVAKLSRLKSYSARRIVDQFRECRRTRWLKRIQMVKSKYRIDRKYQLWKEASTRSRLSEMP